MSGGNGRSTTRGSALAVGLLVLALVGACDEDEPLSSSAASAPAAPVAAAPVAPATPVAEAGLVSGVIDGDTFTLTSGETVRVLGIDSCEMSTDRGPDAKDAAEMRLVSGDVTLEREPGVDRDSFGRLLRYVSVNGSDFGEQMVPGEHTAVYEGGDASAARMTVLRAADLDGRECDEPEPYVAPAPEPDPEPEPERDVYVDPDPDVYVAPPSDDDRSSRGGLTYGPDSGDSGYPCGPGDRDGDGDGWCGES